MKKRTSYIIIAVVIVLGVAIDLISKHFFASYFETHLEDIVVIPNFFVFTFMKNTGAAYGMFGNNTTMLTITSVLFIIAFVVYDIFNHKNDWWYSLGIGFLISGAIGNLVDRLFLGYVRDFISIKLFNFVFNIADLFITIGVICFVIYLIISMVKDHKGKSNGVENNKRWCK